MFNAVNILEALKHYITTRGGQSSANNIAEAVNDLNSIPQSSSGISEAPVDGKQYARKDAEWSEVQSSGSDIPDEVTNAIETNGMGWTSEEEIEGFDIQWDGNTEGLESVANQFYKVSDDILQLDNLTDAMFIIKSETGLETKTGQVFFDGTGGPMYQVYYGDDPESPSHNVAIIIFQDFIFGNETWHAGTYLSRFDENTYISRLYKETSVKEVPHPINIKYIPEESGSKVVTIEGTESGFISNLTPSEVVSIMKTKPVIGVVKMGSLSAPLGAPYVTSTEGSDVVIFYIVSPREESNYGLVPFIKGDVSTDTWTLVV